MPFTASVICPVIGVLLVSVFVLLNYRDKRWIFTIWFPLIVIASGGTLLLLYTVISLGGVSNGPEGGFAGLSLIFLGFCGLPFPVLLYLCLKHHPGPQAYTFPYVSGTIGIFMLATLSPFFLLRQTVVCLTQDENGKPLSGVMIESQRHGEWLPLNGRQQGRTSVSGTTRLKAYPGQVLDLKVSKEGFYVYRTLNRFAFSPEEIAQAASTQHPLIFKLRRKGASDPLVHITRDYRIPRDGMPVGIDLMTGKTTEPHQGSVKVECWTSDIGSQKHIYDWKCQLAVPGGGLVASTNEFDFLAPLEGYRSMDEINMPSTLDSQVWSNDVTRKYFLKLGNGDYAFITFRMIAAGDHFCTIDSFVNPTGSRNLEFDPNNTVKGSAKGSVPAYG